MTVEEFEEKSRSIRLKDNRRICEKGNYETYGYVRGNQLYQQGIHQIRLQFLKNQFNQNQEWSPWIFIGVCSATDRSAFGDVRYHKLRSSIGWSTNGDLWINGMGKRIQWTTIPIENDILTLTIDCDNRVLSLANERTKQKTKDISIDVKDKTPFPWCFYLVFANQGYSVRIL